MQKTFVKPLKLPVKKDNYLDKVLATPASKLKPFKKIWTTCRNRDSDPLESEKKSEKTDKFSTPHLVTPRTRNDISKGYLTATHSARSHKVTKTHIHKHVQTDESEFDPKTSRAALESKIHLLIDTFDETVSGMKTKYDSEKIDAEQHIEKLQLQNDRYEKEINDK